MNIMDWAFLFFAIFGFVIFGIGVITCIANLLERDSGDSEP